LKLSIIFEISQRSLPKNKFTPEEDQLLQTLVHQYGVGNWKQISEHFQNKNPRQVKERWFYYLNQSINTSEWTLEEDETLLLKHREIGNKWKIISTYFQNRTDAQCKNRLNKLQRKFKKAQKNQSKKNKSPPVENMQFNSDWLSPRFDYTFVIVFKYSD
jgi:hypothetical protein